MINGDVKAQIFQINTTLSALSVSLVMLQAMKRHVRIDCLIRISYNYTVNADILIRMSRLRSTYCRHIK